MSGGRFLLGLGPSGPAGGRGLARRSRTASRSGKTREYVDIVRTILRARGAARAPRRALRHPVQRARRDRARQAAEDHRAPAARRHPDLPRGDRPEERRAVRRDRRRLAPDLLLTQRFARRVRLDAASRGGAQRADFDVAPTVTVIVGDDLDTLRGFAEADGRALHRRHGRAGKNFYNDLACRYGFEDAAKKIQDLYLDGNKRDAIAAVPDELVDEIALIGPKERIADRLEAWKESGDHDAHRRRAAARGAPGDGRARPLAQLPFVP